MKGIKQIERENRYLTDVSNSEGHRIDDYEAAERRVD
jgi:hypothetical protein